MNYQNLKSTTIISLLLFFFSFNAISQSPCAWDPEKKEMEFNLSQLSGILNCDMDQKHGKSHHFSNLIYKPEDMMISPDGQRMAGVGMLNFFRVLIEVG